MSRNPRTRFGILVLLGVGFILGYVVACNKTEPIQSADAADADSTPEVSPTKAPISRETYYPNTEDLKPDEMRVIACGTGMPTTRAFQAAACFLVELGNGDKFLFDCGSGSAERI
jgi:hypothetical protein